MKVIGYARVSSEKQREKATIELQVEKIKDYCKKKEFELVDIIRDEHVSGEIPFPQRTGGKALLDRASNKEFQAVVVYDTDRLGRNQLVNETIVVELYVNLRILIFDVEGITDVSTPQGRLMFTMRSAFATAEKVQILKRSIDSTIIFASQGAWLGGIVPFGYKVEGSKRAARLAISDEPIPGLEVSEAEVIRMIYDWSANEEISCHKIAERLQTMRIPCAYSRDQRQVKKNTRKERTANLWRDGRVRNMIVETTYKGIHQWGKRQKPKLNEEKRPIIFREVPAIVDPDTWQKAQDTLVRNRMISSRNSKREYLLRGKIKCGLCGLTFTGTVSRAGKVNPANHAEHPTYEVKDGYYLRPYYVCTGKNNGRGIYGQQGLRCPSRMVSGAFLEQEVWNDIENFLRSPGKVMEEIQKKVDELSEPDVNYNFQFDALRKALADIEPQKSRIFELYRYEVISMAEFTQQMDEIKKEEFQIRSRVAELEAQLASFQNKYTRLQNIKSNLKRLRILATSDPDFATKQAIVDELVERVIVDTKIQGNDKKASIQVLYLFDAPEERSPTMTSTDTRRDALAGAC